MTDQNRRSSDDPTLPISEADSLSSDKTQDGRSTEIRRHQQTFPTKLGKYEVKEQLGAGGMGEVYRAYDSTLNRFVALKILYADHPDSIRRFLEEARIQAGIEHENICKVYEAGQQDGKNFIAMQLIRGKTLLRAAEEMSSEQKLNVLCKVADALQAAHQKGLIHRDIKPTNIMVEKTEEGEWKPFICDFGLARGSEAPNLTMTGMILGTPPYMAPEQARSESRSMDARTDVYALGATLYEILSGKPLYEGKNAAELLVKIMDDEPPPIRDSSPGLPIDLQTIVLRCVEKNPERRYASARSLAEDLRRYLQGEPIVARQTTRTFRWMKKARRNKVSTISVAVSILLLLIIVPLFIQSRKNAERQAQLVGEFGNEVRFIESQLRSAYAAPLHDIRPQINEIKKRLAKLEKRVVAEGKPAVGPGYDALGQCYLAIEDYTKAQQSLEKAWQSGYQQPSTAYALGIVIGKAYQDELLKAERLPNEGLREQKRKEAGEKIGRKAVDYLKKGSTYIESPLYVEALIDLYEKRFDSALKKSKEAFKLSSWPYEPKKLEGDIYLSIGKAAGRSGDTKKAGIAYDSAGKAYREAEELARSNQEIHLALGELYTTTGAMQREKPEYEKFYLQAVDACNKALIANPGSGQGYLCLSRVYYRQGFSASYRSSDDPSGFFLKALESAERAESSSSKVDALIAAGDAYVSLAERESALGKDPLVNLQKAIQKAEKALQIDPHSDAVHSLAGAHFLLGDYQLLHGQNPTAALKKVIQLYHEGLKEVSLIDYMQNVLGLAFLDMGEYKFQRGDDPHSEYNDAIKHFKRGLKISPKAYYIAGNLALAYQRLGALDMNHGRNPKQNSLEAIRYYDFSMEEMPDAVYTKNNKGIVYAQLAEYEVYNHRDPEKELSSAIGLYESAIKLDPGMNYSFLNLASALLIRAQFLLQVGKDPTPTFELAEKHLNESLKAISDFFEAHRVQGELRILEARYEISKKHSPMDKLLLARKSLEQALKISPFDVISYVDMSQTYRWEAVWNKESADAPATGLQWIQKARDQQLKDARLTALEGIFNLMIAKRDQNQAQSKKGNELLNQALKMNPLLKEEYSNVFTDGSPVTPSHTD